SRATQSSPISSSSGKRSTTSSTRRTRSSSRCTTRSDRTGFSRPQRPSRSSGGAFSLWLPVFRYTAAKITNEIGEGPMEMEAAAFGKVQEKLAIESVEIDKPWGREVLVRTAATGVCHSDLHVVDGLGRFPLDRPYVLGHEGAGVVEAVG